MDDFWQEYKGDLQIGDLVEIKKGMMLIEPLGPALILNADNWMYVMLQHHK